MWSMPPWRFLRHAVGYQESLLFWEDVNNLCYIDDLECWNGSPLNDCIYYYGLVTVLDFCGGRSDHFVTKIASATFFELSVW